MNELDLLPKNLQEYAKGPDGNLHAVPFACGVCKVEPAVYGKFHLWYCTFCWQKTNLWKSAHV